MVDAAETLPASYNAPPARTIPRVSCKGPTTLHNHRQNQASFDSFNWTNGTSITATKRRCQPISTTPLNGRLLSTAKNCRRSRTLNEILSCCLEGHLTSLEFVDAQLILTICPLPTL